MTSSTKARRTRRAAGANDNEIDAYARAVVARKIPAGKYHRKACERHFRDLKRVGKPGFPYVFDLPRAERFFNFAQKLKHYKGKKFAGKRIELQPYQKFRLGSIFGWVHKTTGLRRFRVSYNEIPRKNGKSLEAACVMLYLTFFDGEPGAEGYCIATKREQSMLVFNDAAALVRSSGLKNRIKILKRNMNRLERAQKLEALGADHDSTDGLNPSAVCVDEMHAYKNRGLIDVMITAWGARDQPHCFQITTAGDNPVSPCGDEHQYACNVLDEVFEDDRFFAFIAHADVDEGTTGKGNKGDDPFSPATFAKANPNYGVSIDPEGMLADATKAKNNPNEAASFKQKRLNLWVSASAPWLSIEGWKKGQSKDWDLDYCESKNYPEFLLGRECYAGVDLASKADLFPLVLLFPPLEDGRKWSVLRWVWTPGDTLKDRALRDRAHYELWADRGYLLKSPGTNVDHRHAQRKLVELRDVFNIKGIGFDPWHAGTIINDLINDDGFEEEQVIEVPQSMSGITAATQKYEAEVLAGNVDSGNCPLMLWTNSNAVVKSDDTGNIKPTKKRSRGRIDPAVATIIAMALALKMSDSSSVYETREMTVLGG